MGKISNYMKQKKLIEIKIDDPSEIADNEPKDQKHEHNQIYNEIFINLEVYIQALKIIEFDVENKHQCNSNDPMRI